MGSSKKHKDKDREHKKKKKHKSRSRSREREKKHKHEKRDKHDKNDERKHKRPKEEDVYQEPYFEDGEIPGLDLVQGEHSDFKQEYADPYPEEYNEPEASSANGGGGSESLSIEESNRMRAKLGLKPLEATKLVKSEEEKTSKNEDVHKPAPSLTALKKTEKITEKLEAIRQKRKLNQKLGKVKTLADDDDDDVSALAWINKSRKLENQRKEAEKRAKLLDAMDEEFGIGDLISEEFQPKKSTEYGSKDLRGITVEHDQEAFMEGKSVILTLKDKRILDDDDGDALMNVNMVDDERYKTNVENKKKRPDYNPYDDANIDEYGMFKPRDVLDKYDEEIGGKRKEMFQLGSGGKYDTAHERQMKRFKEDVRQMGETLELPAPNIASEFYTKDEMASFKKVKKKVRKIRKKPKVVTANDLLDSVPGDEYGDLGSRSSKRRRQEEEVAAIPGLDLVEPAPMDLSYEEPDLLGPEEDLTGVTVEDDAAHDLEAALSKTRRLKQKGNKDAERKILQHVQEVGMNESDDEGPASSRLPGGPNITLNSTSEFCRTLGDIPTYGQAGNREEDEDELMDFERELAEERKRKQEEELAATGWQSVEIDETPIDIQGEEKGPLDEEPTLNTGIASALQLGMKKGYFESETIKKSMIQSKTKVMETKNYSIEDKQYEDLDEKYNRKNRDRFGSGIAMDFKELSNYKPDVKIDYVDESGRNLNPKEAFRQLSHRFHGKGSGKRKQEKRSKKLEQDNLLMTASSTDTPLGTVAMLQEKQKQEKSPFIVLSGSNKGMTASSLAKT